VQHGKRDTGTEKQQYMCGRKEKDAQVKEMVYGCIYIDISM
jgi:hypothetical protein